jgi:predicted dehydrogenase
LQRAAGRGIIKRKSFKTQIGAITMAGFTRRHFFYSAGMALTAAEATRVAGANDRVQMGIVGLGGRGGNHMSTFGSLAESVIVAVCDIDQAALERGVARVEKATQRKPKGYGDMRQLFADKEVEAVSFATPNHWHALGTIWACQAGKDVYVEKPACHNVFEGLRMVEAARKYKRMVQVGSQGRSAPHMIQAMQLLKEGVIGKVYMSKGLCFKRRKSIGHAEDGPVPPGVDWDMFLGPAPKRPFNTLRFKYNWHWFWDTGNGDIGNQGIHEMDKARWGLGDPGLPTSVVSTGGKYVYDDDQETPNTQIATFDYGDRQIVFEVRGILTGSEGGLAADRSGGNVIGDLYYGSDGWMCLGGGSFQVYKGEKGEKIMDEKATGGEAPHFRNFLQACKSRNYKELNADVEAGVTSACLVHLANISYRLKRLLKFDPKKMVFPGDAEANKMLTRVPRPPYAVPEKV